MEGTLRQVKCSSTWTSSAAGPPQVLQAAASGSVNQIDVNPQEFLLPFIPQGTTLGNRYAVQEPLALRTFNLDFSKPGKTDLGNSFLSLLSTNPHHLHGEFSQLTKLSDGLSSATPGVQLTSIPLSPQNSYCTGGSGWKATIPSFDESRALLMSYSPNATEGHNTLKLSTCKPVPDQAFQDISVGKPSMSCNWANIARPGNTGQHQPLNIQTNQISQRMPTEAGSTAPRSDSARPRGRPRVICMKSVGELFLSELGLLGVICFCHNLRMSVAKFCEHSGSSANPSDTVRLENGMTVAQWRKLCFGNNAPEDDKGWDWSDCISVKNSFVKSRGCSYPSLPQNPRTADSIKTVVGFTKSGDPWNKSSYAKPPCTGVQQASMKYPINKVAEDVHHNNRLDRVGFISPSEGHLPILSKSHTLHAVKENPNCLNSVSPHSTLNKGEHNIWSRLASNGDNCKGKFGTQSLRDPLSDALSLTHGSTSSKNSFASEAFIIARDGNSSNIDLHLGQPSQIHTSLSSLSTAMNPMQFGRGRNPQKSQANLPLTENSDHPVTSKKPRIGSLCTSDEPSIRHTGPSRHAVGIVNTSSHSEPKELAGKSSLISLFLSHLNTEGSNASQLTTIVNNSELSMLDSASAKCNQSENMNAVNGGNKRINFLDGLDLSSNLDKGKGQTFENEFYDPVKASFMVHSKTTDTAVPMQAIGGQCLHNVSSLDDKRFSLHFNQPSHILQGGPVSLNFNQHGKVPFGIMGHFNSATNSSTNPVPYSAARTGHLNCRTPMNANSSNSLYFSRTASAHAKSTDHSQHLTDDNMKLLALRDMVELSKQQQSTVNAEEDTRNQRSYLHSRVHRNLREGDSAAVEDLRQGAYHDTQQNASEFAVESAWPCSNCFSGISTEMLAIKHGTRGRNEFCNCTILTQKDSQCSKEQNISTCHICCADEHPCLRLGRMPNYICHSVKQIFDQKEQTQPFYGKCCCSILSKHLIGCCLSGNFTPSGSKERVCGKHGTGHITQASDEGHMCHDRGSLNFCECTKKHFDMKNDVQTGFWRDVPAKKVGHSDAISTDKPAQVLKSLRGTEDQLQGTTSKGYEGTEQEDDLVNEQQMSNVCSGASAPATTEISVEVNKGNYHAMNCEDNKTAHDSVADEGSVVEKCGSSDGALGIRKHEETPIVNDKVHSDESRYSLPNYSSSDPIDDLRLQTSSSKNNVRNHMHVQRADQESFKKTKMSKEENRKERMKMKKLDVLVPEFGSTLINSESSHCVRHLKWELSLPDESKSLCQPGSMVRRSTVKRKRTPLFSSEPLSAKTNNHYNILKSYETQLVDDDQSLRTLAALSEKEELTLRGEERISNQEGNHFDSGKPPKYISLNSIAKCDIRGTGIVNKKVRPVVCGKSGIISNGAPRGPKKPVKIVSLSLILKRSKRCDRNEYGAKSKKPLNSRIRKFLNENNGNFNGSTSWKLHCKNEDSIRNKTSHATVCMSDVNKRCFKKSVEHVDEFSMIENETEIESNSEEDSALHYECKISQIMPRCKEVRRCSLNKLLGNDKHGAKLSYDPNSGASCTLTMNGMGDQREASSSTAMGNSLIGFDSGKGSLNNEDQAGELSRIITGRSAKVQKYEAFLLSSDASCCVCGSSNNEDINCMLECNHCLIRVHQACYGVSKVPRGHWFCRPCKTNTENTVCVLCGYDGGAMTRAVKSQNIVKSLIKAWNFGTFLKSVSSSEKVIAVEPCFVSEASKCGNSGSVISVRSACPEPFPDASVDLTSQNQTCGRFLKGLQMYNSITAGVLDPSVTQWVHMVCGLWTPGTRCPNVDTMSAFDVSGASATRKNIVCSMCNRPGGCCIQCRVPKCPDHFHPWCAHQKGLLQSEIEGVDNEKVGFYGKCMLHAAQDGIHVDSPPVDTELGPRKTWSCARTQGFEDWKSEEVLKSKQHQKPPCNDNGGCIVSQEQRNAWLHINGQNSCKRAVIKPPCSDFEYDFGESSGNPRSWKKVDRTCTLLNQVQKEYFCYKQSKAWKHLVVYKSGIHALGLYTSKFIARGAMVVEYVGEIVGQRVADKREIEYQSGRKLQYKTACYFFRIDKEHIIDATRRGGIARFVNHSCQPNCVAKIISVRNDKKVVFFAERDIYPGEEITYDYHFNSEDEGEKIPCYCNSKNCRRYLN